MLPHTTSAVSAFPEDGVGRPTQFASKTGVGTTGLFLCSNALLFLCLVSGSRASLRHRASGRDRELARALVCRHAPGKKINISHTHTPTEDNTPDTDTHAHDKNNTPNPQTNTSHEHSTTLGGGATTVRATSRPVGGRAEVSVRGRIEVRRSLRRARVQNTNHNEQALV